MERSASGPSDATAQKRPEPSAVPTGGRELSYGQALLEALSGELARDPKVVFFGAKDSGSPASLLGWLAKGFEDHRVGAVAGSVSDLVTEAIAASGRGLRPLVELPRSAPCSFSWAGASGREPGGRLPPPLFLHIREGAELFCTRHLLLAFPGLRVVAASDPFSVQGMIRAALRGDEPILCLTHRALMETRGKVPRGDYVVSPARARLLRSGNDVTVVAHHVMLAHSLTVAGELAEAGVSVEVLDPVSLAPLDEETLLASVRKTGRLVIVEDPAATPGPAAEMAAVVCEKAFFALDAPVKRVGTEAKGVPGRDNMSSTTSREIREAIASIL